MDFAGILTQPDRRWTSVPGAPEERVRRLASLAPVRLPGALLDLLRFSDGGEGELALPPYWFVMDSVSAIVHSLLDPSEREQYAGFVFFGGNGGLERLALDCRSGTEPWPVVMIDPIAGPESAEPVAPRFEVFAAAIGLEHRGE